MPERIELLSAVDGRAQPDRVARPACLGHLTDQCDAADVLVASGERFGGLEETLHVVVSAELKGEFSGP